MLLKFDISLTIVETLDTTQKNINNIYFLSLLVNINFGKRLEFLSKSYTAFVSILVALHFSCKSFKCVLHKNGLCVIKSVVYTLSNKLCVKLWPWGRKLRRNTCKRAPFNYAASVANETFQLKIGLFRDVKIKFTIFKALNQTNYGNNWRLFANCDVW